MGKTSTEVKQRWMNANYNRYIVNLRKDTDKDLIEYVEKNKAKYGTTEIFRAGIEALIERERESGD